MLEDDNDNYRLEEKDLKEKEHDTPDLWRWDLFKLSSDLAQVHNLVLIGLKRVFIVPNQAAIERNRKLTTNGYPASSF